MQWILLTTTAIVAFAGAAAADGHVTMSWSGTATAGIAREGGSDAVASAATANDIATLVADYAALPTIVAGSGVTEAALRADLADEIAQQSKAVAALSPSDAADATNASVVALKAAQDLLALLNGVSGAADAVATGDFDTYAEVNATVTGSVAMDGVTVTAAMSVDAGTGYDFADDDGFDTAKTNGVALDFVTIDAGAMGALTLDKNDIAHLVDGDDDANGDIKYTNDLGIASVEVVMDLDTDTNVVAARESVTRVTTPTGAAGELSYTAAVAADVAWSAKVSAPVADIATVYAAFDEEGGNAVGGSATIEGVTITVDSKLEALEEELGEARSNTIGASYTAAGLTVGGAYNTVKDGNQWSINAAYAADGFSVAYSTNEGEEWSATASYALSENASIEAGVNYTEDAFVGVAFNF